MFALTCRRHRYPDAEAVAKAAAQRIICHANQACARRRAFRIVLAGGTTPRLAYQLLAARSTPWPLWHVYFSDERCLSPEDPERNSCMAAEALLDHVPVPIANIHPIPAEKGAAEAARYYAEDLRYAPPFDMVLLGMGEDGHTASLFPGHVHDPVELVHPVYAAPKPPPERVSLSFPLLMDTHALLVLVTGAGKRDALRAWQADADLPIAHLKPLCGVDVLADAAALGE